MSAGVAIFPNHGPTADTVLRAADLALYSAKAAGRNRVVVSRAGALFIDDAPTTPDLREIDE
jgi:predicted signal transduction protein with EAL and GGDEF domain